MRCDPFEILVKKVLEHATEPRIQSVHTFAEAGLPKPFGVEVTLSDGHAWQLQFVRTSPPAGDTDGYRLPDGDRKLAPERTAPANRPARPPMGARELERLLRRALLGCHHPEVVKVRTFAESGHVTKPVGLRVGFSDQSEIFVMFLGATSPGANRFNHPDFKLPEGAL